MENKNEVISKISRIKKDSFQYIEKELKAREIDGIMVSHGNILDILYENNGKLTMKEISKRINRTKSTVTQLVDKLIKFGYVTKIQNAEDKRYSYIALTDEGFAIKEHFKEISENLINKFYKNFSDEESQTLILLLNKVIINFED